MTDISVIVCTHNPRCDYLERLVEALKWQTLPEGSWELLVVDNASNERLADTWDLSWHARARHIREVKLGLTHARLCGIGESRGELVVFLDDDNVPASDFLEQASAIYAQYPNLGVFGAGLLTPEFEFPLPSEFRPRLQMLAVRTVSSVRWSNNTTDFETIPWGAGLCVSRPVANLYRNFVGGLDPAVLNVLDRRGKALYDGGDDVFSSVAVSVGYGFGIFPQLRVTHLIASDRLNRSYFLKLAHDHALSACVRHYVFAGIQPRRIEGTQYARLLLHGIRNGLFSMRCQWANLRGEERAARLILEKGLWPVEIPRQISPKQNDPQPARIVST
jgi:glycosyltransferase involved in cell wall biosynthesis